MSNELEIKPKVGFGELKFGVDMKSVENYFGPPQETETINVEDEIQDVELWSYWELGHSVYFEKELDSVCTNFETDNEEVTLFGSKIFEFDEQQLIDLMKENGYPEFETEEEEPGERILFFPDAHLQFVIEDEELALVSWAVAMDDDDKILWP
jgi:hypothetical protein